MSPTLKKNLKRNARNGSRINPQARLTRRFCHLWLMKVSFFLALVSANLAPHVVDLVSTDVGVL